MMTCLGREVPLAYIHSILPCLVQGTVLKASRGEQGEGGADDVLVLLAYFLSFLVLFRGCFPLSFSENRLRLGGRQSGGAFTESVRQTRPGPDTLYKWTGNTSIWVAACPRSDSSHMIYTRLP